MPSWVRSFCSPYKAAKGPQRIVQKWIRLPSLGESDKVGGQMCSFSNTASKGTCQLNA